MQVAGELAGTLVSVGIPAILGLQVFLVRKVSAHDVRFTKIETVLLGPNGNNGLNGRIVAIEQNVEDIKGVLPERPERRHHARRVGDPQ